MAKKVALIVLAMLAHGCLAYATPRTDWLQTIGLFVILGLVYWAFWQQQNTLLTCLLLRCVWCVATPELSDDFYRFLWDGRWLVEGFNPYLILPSDYPQLPLFSQLNSPNYYTVYPPINQFLFAVGPMLFSENTFAQILTLRVMILIFDIGNIIILQKLLVRMGRSPKLAMLYGLHPLVVMEGVGNLHFEVGMLFFVLLAVYFLPSKISKFDQESFSISNSQFSGKVSPSGRFRGAYFGPLRPQWGDFFNTKSPFLVLNKGLFSKPKEVSNLIFSALSFAVAISIKLIPILFIPLFIKQLWLKKGIVFTSITLLFCTIFWLPFLSEALVSHFGSSISLYFRTFEFNASLYYLVRSASQGIVGYNPIAWTGPLLGLIGGGAILTYVARTRAGMYEALLVVQLIYLAFATTVHPWYVLPLVAWSVLSGKMTGIVWGIVIGLSYSRYAFPTENLLLTFAQYAVVGGTIWYDFFNNNHESNPNFRTSSGKTSGFSC